MCLCLYAAGIIYSTVNQTVSPLFQSPGRLRWSGPGQPLFSLPQRCCCFSTKNPCSQFTPFMSYCGATKTGSCQPFTFCILRSIQYLASLIRYARLSDALGGELCHCYGVWTVIVSHLRRMCLGWGQEVDCRDSKRMFPFPLGRIKALAGSTAVSFIWLPFIRYG